MARILRQGDVLVREITPELFHAERAFRQGANSLALGSETGKTHSLQHLLYVDKAQESAVLNNQETIQLIHPEHGILNIPPGYWQIERGVREYAGRGLGVRVAYD